MQTRSDQLPPPGEYRRVVFPAIAAMPVWLYRPVQIRRADKVLIAVHGISRDAKEQIEAYKTAADELGCWLVAPEFSARSFPRYQQLCKGNGYPRADLALNSFMVLWRSVVGQPYLKAYLTGYSGGAQFAHRYALHHPEQLAALVLSSAGWYSFPDHSVKYPRGVKNTVSLRRVQLEGMLKLPILITVGELDTERDGSLRKGKALDMQQGRTRYERAINWCNALRSLQKQQNYRPAQLKLLPGQRHNFSENVKQGGMVGLVIPFLQSIEGVQNESTSNLAVGLFTDNVSRMSGKA